MTTNPAERFSSRCCALPSPRSARVWLADLFAQPQVRWISVSAEPARVEATPSSGPGEGARVSESSKDDPICLRPE